MAPRRIIHSRYRPRTSYLAFLETLTRPSRIYQVADSSSQVVGPVAVVVLVQVDQRATCHGYGLLLLQSGGTLAGELYRPHQAADQLGVGS